MIPSLTVSAAARRRLALILVCCLGLFSLLPTSAALARVEMSNGSGLTEGDPTDGNDVLGGGGGLDYEVDNGYFSPIQQTITWFVFPSPGAQLIYLGWDSDFSNGLISNGSEINSTFDHIRSEDR